MTSHYIDLSFLDRIDSRFLVVSIQDHSISCSRLSAFPDNRSCFSPGVICALVVIGLVVPSQSLTKNVCNLKHTWVVLIMVSPCAVCISTTFSLHSVQFSKDYDRVDVAPLSTISAPSVSELVSLPMNAHSFPASRAFAASSDILIISAPS
jgi:hypothetical protein